MNMICYGKGNEEDTEAIIDFANYVFSQNDRPHDFKKILPKLYADGQNSAEYHYLAKEDTKIKAMVCAAPVEFKVLQHSLKACCIGTVSVHPYARGKGYMKSLLHTALEDMRKTECAYAILGGQRQRYEYFGFEPAGVQMRFTVTETNIRHFCNKTGAPKITISSLTDEKWIEAAYLLFQSQITRAVRSREDFVTILRSWDAEPYVILREDVFAGYASMQASGEITELLLADPTLYPLILKPLCELSNTASLYVNAEPWETQKIRFFSQVAESWEVKTNESYVIFDWAATILAFLQLKATYEQLSDGTLTIAIADIRLQITVSANAVYVSESQQEADISLSPLNAVLLLFSSLGEFVLKDCIVAPDKQKCLCIKSWFPLPIFSSIPDCC